MKAYHWKDLLAERAKSMRLAAGAPAPDAPDVKVNVPPRREPPAVIATPAPRAPSLPSAPHIVTPAPVITTRRIVPAVTPGKPICIECRYHARRMCTNPNARNPVTGTYVEAERARRYEDGCGPRGRLWEARPAYTVDVAPREGEPMEYAPPAFVKVRKQEPFIDAQVVDFWPIIRACRAELHPKSSSQEEL